MKDQLPVKNENGGAFKRVIALILAVAALVFAFTFGYFFSRWTRPGLNEILEIYDIAHDTYAGGEISEEDFARYLVNSVFDKYSEYYTAEEYEKVKKQSAGGYSGLGFSLAALRGDAEYDAAHKFTAYKVNYDSPAYRAGLRARDKIVGYYDGDTPVYFNSRVELTACLSALKSGEEIKLAVRRDSPFGTQSLIVTTAKGSYKRTYTLYADSEKKVNFILNEAGTDIEGEAADNDGSDGVTGLDDNTAYIAISSFEGTVAREVRALLKYMKSRGRTKLILDLSDNGGGYIDVLCEVASSFIYYSASENPVVLYARDKNGRLTHFTATADAFPKEITSISVIANENSASATECLIGAMLHYWGMRYSYDPVFNYNKLVLVRGADGIARTYGKGVMQTSYTLSTGAVFKLTTATLTFPDMTTCINGVGIRYPEWATDPAVTDFYGALDAAKARV